MKAKIRYLLLIMTLFAMLAAGCNTTNPTGQPAGATTGQIHVLAVENFLADIARNVAGDRMLVTSLIPAGLDPHSYEMTPQDIVSLSRSDLVLINGSGFEAWFEKMLAASQQDPAQVIEVSRGLTPRVVDGQIDPHFWLDPNMTIVYVENIRDAFIKADPAGSEVYRKNAESYIIKLKELDSWIKSELSQIPAENRMLVTNHESFGYFIDRYGFKLIGSLLPSPSSEEAPSARQMASLIDSIRANKIKAVFVETGANVQLADQLASETGITVITDLYTHSLSTADGPAPTYIDMMKYNVLKIVEVLK